MLDFYVIYLLILDTIDRCRYYVRISHDAAKDGAVVCIRGFLVRDLNGQDPTKPLLSLMDI